MFSEEFMRRILWEYVGKGCRNYAIYPFGINGRMAKSVLKEYFDIDPLYIIDNTLSKHNKCLVPIEKYRELDEKDCHIILTAENEYIVRELLYTLDEMVLQTGRVINLHEISKDEQVKKDGFYRSMKNRLSPDIFLPSLQKYRKTMQNICSSIPEKIKIRILHPAESVWNTVRTICQAFEQDNQYDVLVVVNGDYTSNAAQMESEKHCYIFDSDYDAELDKPDVFISYYPRIELSENIRKVRMNCKLVIAATMTLIRYDASEGDLRKFYQFLIKGFEALKPDYFLFDRLMYQELGGSGLFGDQLVEMGNAKYDDIYAACNTEKRYLDSWRKLQDKKKVILWATDHNLSDTHICPHVTFDLYIRSMVEYFSNNRDMGLIIRLHPTYIKELLNYGYWQAEDLRKVKEYFEKSDNIVWDDTNDYYYAFNVCDAILLDPMCGMLCTALPSLKPTAVLFRNDMITPILHPEIMDAYYRIYDEPELYDFFRMVRNGRDDKFILRKDVAQKYVKHFDGENGRRIKRFIEKEFDVRKLK